MENTKSRSMLWHIATHTHTHKAVTKHFSSHGAKSAARFIQLHIYVCDCAFFCFFFHFSFIHPLIVVGVGVLRNAHSDFMHFEFIYNSFYFRIKATHTHTNIIPYIYCNWVYVLVKCSRTYWRTCHKPNIK